MDNTGSDSKSGAPKIGAKKTASKKTTKKITKKRTKSKAMTTAEKSEIIEALSQHIQQARKDESWIQRNWPTLLAFIGQVVVALLLIGKMSGSIEQLQASLADVKNVMVQKETVELEFAGVRTSLQAIKDNQAATDKRVEDMERRALDATHR